MSDTEAFDPDEQMTSSEGSAVSVVKVGGKNYAVGLIWNDVEDRASAPAEARALAGRPTIDADLYCVRSQGQQFGLGWRKSGHAKNMASLAGHLADNRNGTSGTWIGLFEVDAGYYLVAVRDELILSTTDKVYADDMEARSAFEDLHGLAEWGEIYAPEDFGFEDASSASLDDMVSTGKPPRLMDIDKVNSLLKWGAVALVVTGAVVGGMLYLDHQDQLAMEEELRRLTEAATRTLPGQSQPKVEVPPAPWEGRFAGGDFLLKCSQGLNKAVLYYPGWRATSLECSSTGGVSLGIERAAALGQGGGTITWVRWALDRTPLKDASATSQGDGRVAISWQMEAPEQHKPVLAYKTPLIGKTRHYLQSWFEESFTPIQFTTVEENQFYKTLRFKFTTPYDPAKFSPIIERVPGATIDKVSVDLKRQPFEYTVEGAVHEQLPLPPGAVAPKPATN